MRVENILNALELKEAFKVVITQEHVTKHKPDPEAFNLVLSKLGVTPEQAIIFEDSQLASWLAERAVVTWWPSGMNLMAKMI